MMKIKILILVGLLIVSCKKKPNDQSPVQPSKTVAITDSILENAVIYEANIRQYSSEGTFKAFTKDLSKLKELGVKVIWLMPINPISEVKRKATDGSFTSDIKDEKEREKYLGSYYSVSDYKAINPEFGTKADFDDLVTAAHKNGIYVIVDWVPNHTGWDHPWIAAHPEWYTQNDKGEIIDPINPDTGKSWGWTDVADLNYDNKAMRQEMINDLKYWVENHNIDGYRMDVAHKVPPAFFNEAITEMRKIKPLFMLAEAEQQELFRNGFDMQYAWEGHHLLNEMAQGKKRAKDFENYIKAQDTIMHNTDFKMNFVTNHDENSWNGTVKERMGDASEIFTALVYTMPGMPLIYSGQEYDLNHRLKFFEKDSIPKQKGKTWGLLKKLGALKNNYKALNGGKHAANYKTMQTKNENVLAFKRTKENESVYFIGNFSNTTQTYKVSLNGTFTDVLNASTIQFNTNEMQLSPWAFYVLKQ